MKAGTSARFIAGYREFFRICEGDGGTVGSTVTA